MNEKSRRILFRVTPEEEKKYKEDADKAGLTLSEYIRKRLNGSKVEAKQPITDKQTVANLRQAVGLLKQLFRYEKITGEQLDKSLKEIYNIIELVKNSD